MDGDEKYHVNVLKEASCRTKFFVDRCGTCLLAYLNLRHATVTRIQCPSWELSEGPWERGSSHVYLLVSPSATPGVIPRKDTGVKYCAYKHHPKATVDFGREGKPDVTQYCLFMSNILSGVRL